jgi:hypothetical protein
LGYLGIDWRIILKWILKKKDVKMWIGFIWHRTGYNGWFLRTLGSIKGAELLHQLRDC